MMNKWEVARYLIDAKKNIDSIMYINKNILNNNFLFININKQKI